MANIVQLVQEKTGISEEQAKIAVDTVVGYLKDNLPGPIAAQVDGLLGADATDTLDQASSMLGGLGGMFGKNNG